MMVTRFPSEAATAGREGWRKKKGQQSSCKDEGKKKEGVFKCSHLVTRHVAFVNLACLRNAHGSLGLLGLLVGLDIGGPLTHASRGTLETLVSLASLVRRVVFVCNALTIFAKGTFAILTSLARARQNISNAAE